jgi:N,N'-diacetyllegionaminate synthase
MTEIIAEIAQAHDGSLGILHSYIDAVAKAGVDTVKFQMHIADAESSAFEPFRVNFSYVDKTRFDYWKRMEFTFDQWQEIINHCNEKKINFLCSPFSIEAVNNLEKLGATRYKIASGEILNKLMLSKIAATKKPVLISSGMSNYEELDHAINFLKDHTSQLSVFQCTTAYPTPAEQVGLNVISELKSRYNLPVGLSDHSGEIYPSLAAVSLGASLIEVHAVFDKEMFGPDAKSSLNMQQLGQLVEGIRFLDRALQNPVNKNDTEKYTSNKIIFGKSLAVNRDVQLGDYVLLEHLESKKPGDKGIPAAEFEKIVGKKYRTNLSKGVFINYSDIE